MRPGHVLRRTRSIASGWLLVPILTGFLGACGGGPARANDLSHLSDEFANPYSLPLWQRVHVVEAWGAEQLETFDIGVSRAGWLTMVPWTCTWYQDWRGPMAFKSVGGDFVVTALVESRGRDGVSIPDIPFSLGGLMIRTPRAITPATWTPGGENYVFLSIGYGSAPTPRWQYEVKTTVAGASTLILSDAPGPLARLQIARIGDFVLCLRQEPGGPWQVHRRYVRPDLPDTLQVGMVAYTDWTKTSQFAPFVHNGAVLTTPLPPGVVDPDPFTPFHPDLITRWDYVRYFRPTLPASLVGIDLTNSGLVPDAELLAFLGAVADTVCPQGAAGEAVAPDTEPALRVIRGPGGTPSAFRVSVPAGVPWRLELFDVAGRRLRTLGMGGADGGTAEVRWPSDRLAAGVYLARLAAGGQSRSERIVYRP